MRLKWTKQYAMIDTSGTMTITSSSAYAKLVYELHGAQAELQNRVEGSTCFAVIAIKMKPCYAYSEGSSKLTFRPVERQCEWLQIISRFANVQTSSVGQIIFVIKAIGQILQGLATADARRSRRVWTPNGDAWFAIFGPGELDKYDAHNSRYGI